MKRILLILIFFLILGAAIGGRLYILQIRDHGFYKALAQGQQGIVSFAKGQRGTIFAKDKEGLVYLLAANHKVPFAFASPAEIEDPGTTAEIVSHILAISKETILPILQKEESFFEILKKQIDEDTIRAIQAEHIKGMYVGSQETRLYPQGNTASHVLGFVNQEGKGQYGIENYYNETLEGKEGIRRNFNNPASFFFSAFADTIEQGQDLTLTIDYHIQSMAQDLLEKAMETLKFEEGSIVVMDPSNGKILALANTPSFDPNEYSKIKSFELFQNSVTEKIFEPGSAFKPITMVSAIDAGALTPDTAYEDKGILQIGGYKIYNYDNRVWGKRSMREVLEFSINTGAVFAQEQLGNEKFLEYLEKFGIFKKTNVDLPGEVYSLNKEFRQGYAINFATAAFGQGIEMTPIQLLRAFGAIANGGRLVKPYVREGAKQEISEPIISADASRAVTSMLIDVVEKGYAKPARIPGYYVAGKTGTAQISWSALGVQKSGYSDKTIQSFIGYAPAYDPKFIILVKLQNPATKTAEYSAVPIFRDLAKYMLDYLEIPPDYEIE